MKRIVIVGGGFAGVAVAHTLERCLRPDEAETVLISRENFSLFTPMLPEVSSGALDVRHVVTPVRSELRRTQFILAQFKALDEAHKVVVCTHSLTGEDETLHYDQLVLALGSGISTFNLPGIAEHTFALKTLEDAGILRNRLMWSLELADATEDEELRKRLLTIVIVGGGFTGVEAAGELTDLFRSVIHFYHNLAKSAIRIVLVEGGSSLLPGLPERMGSYSAKSLSKRGVEILTGDPVASADGSGLTLQSGRRIPSETIIWSAGVKPSPALAETSLPRRKNGSIIVDQDLHVSGVDGIWALGDCAAVPNGKGGFYPATAQHAIREGPLAAQNILATLHGKPTKPFHFNALGMMASLGGRRAVAQLPGNYVLTGFLAWFLWRTYYLARLPGLDRKFRVAFDWTLELIFPRDIAELRVYTRQTQSTGRDSIE